MTFPRLRLRDEVAGLLDLPWETPLADWMGDGTSFRELPVGPSRHLVRFLVSEGMVYALKELPAPVAVREQVLHRGAHPAPVVDDDRVRLDALGRAVDEDDGRAALDLRLERRVVRRRRGHDERADPVGFFDDGLDILNVCALEEHV